MAFMAGMLLGVLLVVAVVLALQGCRIVPPPNNVLLVTSGYGTRAYRGARFVWPFIEETELVDMTVKPIDIVRLGREGLHTRDGVRMELKATFFIRVSERYVIAVARSVGPKRLASAESLRGLFEARFLESMKACLRTLDLETTLQDPDAIRDSTLKILGRSLNGFVLDGMAVSYLAPAGLEDHDQSSLLDAKGIRVLTRRMAEQAAEAAAPERKRAIAAADQRLDNERRRLQAVHPPMVGAFPHGYRAAS
jgi:uncharacterized membrane protein YqiK